VDLAQDRCGVVLEGPQDLVLRGAQGVMRTLELRGEILAGEGACLLHRGLGEPLQRTPRGGSDRLAIALGCRIGEKAPNVSLGLARGRVEIKTQEVKHLEEGPEVGRTHGASLVAANDLTDLPGVTHRLLREETGCRQSMSKVIAIARRARAIQEPPELPEERVGASLHDENKAVALCQELGRILKVLPEIEDGL
jgi:hypothetical protein